MCAFVRTLLRFGHSAPRRLSIAVLIRLCTRVTKSDRSLYFKELAILVLNTINSVLFQTLWLTTELKQLTIIRFWFLELFNFKSHFLCTKFQLMEFRVLIKTIDGSIAHNYPSFIFPKILVLLPDWIHWLLLLRVGPECNIYFKLFLFCQYI